MTEKGKEDDREFSGPVQIRVDQEGDWFYEGRPIFRPEILALFYEQLRLREDGRYCLEWQGECHPIEVEDTPFVITRVDKEEDPSGKERIVLSLKHVSEKEVLDPESLYVGKDNVLYCRIRMGRFPARFSRPAYYQIAQWIEPDSSGTGFVLPLNGNLYPIHGSKEA